MRTLLIILAVWLLPANCASDTNYRLSTPISPERYSIWITPYFDTADENAFTFDGRVTIAIKTDTVVKQIQLHSEDLIINATTGVTVTQGSTVINLNETNPLVFDTNYTFVYINLATDLNPNVEYTVDITYRGPIRNDLNGFYRNYYMDGGVKKWLGATQMEPTHARKVFPCFDEPAYKAKFTLTITRPATYAPTLANTKRNSVVQQNERVQETFFETPLMSTYLVAFMVSEFEAAQHSINGTKELGIYAQPSAKNYSEYAFEFSKDVVNALSEYFDFDYYSVDTNLKLDHVALPDFRAGAMENWGLINYRESYLMYTPQESTPSYRYRVSQIIAHETTHMWFGNLVTCHWWSNIWLNEGFANYFQDYITAKIRPDVRSNDMLVISSVYDAYDADEATSVAAITNEEVNSPAEISGHFGLISYQKAGSVIRMMHHAMGDVAFQQGLRTYLRENQLNVGDPDKLYSALNQGLQTTNTTTSIADLTNMMKSWIVQSGHPVLQVNVDYDQQVISFSQKRFYIDSKNSTNEIYHIPITVATKSQPNFGDTKPMLIMNTKELNLNLTNATHEWIIVNIQETGFYRVNYDEHSWLMISNALKEERNVIHYLNRAKIVNDLFAFMYADLINFDLLYEVLGFLKEEDEFAVLNAAIRGLNKLRNSYLGTSALEHIESYSLEILGPVIERLGFEVKNDSYVTQRNRMQVLEFACKLGHEGCVNFAVTTLKQLKENGTYVHPSLRPTVYCNGLRHGDSSDYEFLWERMSTTTVANEARTIGEALGCTKDKESLRKYLTSISGDNSTIRVQDLTMPLSSALLTYNNLDLVLDLVQENYVAWTKEYSSMESILATVASALHTEAEFTKFETWLSNCTTECSETSISAAKTALNQARLSATWAADHMEEILKSLRNSATMSVPSTLLVSITLFFLFFK